MSAVAATKLHLKPHSGPETLRDSLVVSTGLIRVTIRGSVRNKQSQLISSKFIPMTCSYECPNDF